MISSHLEVFDQFVDGIEETADQVVTRLRLTDSEGFNSLELARVGEPWPMLSIFVNRDWCVIHHFEAEDHPPHLLRALSTADLPDEVPFKYAHEPAITNFTREYLNSLATAETYIHAFANRAPWPEGPVWDVL